MCRPSQPLYTRPGSRESIYVYRYTFLTLTCSVRQVFCTFLTSRGLLCRCQLAGQGDPCDSSVGLLSSGTPGRPIIRSRGVTPSSLIVLLMMPKTLHPPSASWPKALRYLLTHVMILL